jgi:hypothetical protein
VNQDLEHLRILSIFHFVVAALAGVFACIPFIHFFMGLAMVLGRFGQQEPFVPAMGALFMLVGGVAILAGWTFAVCMVIAGRRLAVQRNHTFCLVMAAIGCMFMPFGTVLGVLTILVLMRPSVKELFDASAASPGTDAAT